MKSIWTILTRQINRISSVTSYRSLTVYMKSLAIHIQCARHKIVSCLLSSWWLNKRNSDKYKNRKMKNHRRQMNHANQHSDKGTFSTTTPFQWTEFGWSQKTKWYWRKKWLKWYRNGDIQRLIKAKHLLKINRTHLSFYFFVKRISFYLVNESICFRIDWNNFSCISSLSRWHMSIHTMTLNFSLSSKWCDTVCSTNCI